MNFKAKSIKMPEKRQRADAYRRLTQLNTDKGTQQIIQGEGRGRIVSLTRKSSVKRKRPENACVSCLCLRGFLIIINHHVQSYIFQTVFIVEVAINRQLD